MRTNFRRTDFTQGSIPRHLIAFTIPMFIGNLLQALYNTIDSIWVGQFLGPQALAAVSVSFSIIFALISLVVGLTMAVTTLVSQYYGAGDYQQVKKTIANAFILLSLFALLLSFIGILSRKTILVLINVPPDVLELAAQYLGVFLVGLVPMFLYNVAGAILRGLGDSHTPLKFLAYATGLNILLDPVLIFGLGPIPSLGIAGAALATVIAQSISAIVAIKYLAHYSKLLDFNQGIAILDRDLAQKIFVIGLPAGIQQMFVSLSGLAVNSLVNRFGSVTMAGFGVGLKLEQFAFLPALSLGIAVSALVGQNLGANKGARVGAIVKWSALLGVGLTGLGTVVAVAWPHFLVALFSHDPQVIHVGVVYLRIVSLSYMAYALMFTFNGVLRGAGDTLASMLITIFALWAVRVPLAAYLSSLPGLAERGVFYGVFASPIVGMLMYYAYYRTGRWKRHTITSTLVESENT